MNALFDRIYVMTIVVVSGCAQPMAADAQENIGTDQQEVSCSIGGCVAGWTTSGSCKYHQSHVGSHCVANTNCRQVVVDFVEFRGGTASGCCDSTNDGLWWTQGGIELVDDTSGSVLWASGALLHQTNCSTNDGYHKYNVGKTIARDATVKFFW